MRLRLGGVMTKLDVQTTNHLCKRENDLRNREKVCPLREIKNPGIATGIFNL
jgi:hypothetical protein